MKEQLTLEHIAPYLPHGLKVSCFFKDNNGELSFEREGVLVGIKTETNPDREHPIKIKTRSHAESRFYSELAYNWDEVKPHLRSLGQLTEEIEHKGERFVPMVRLLELTERNAFSKDDRLRVYSSGIPVNVIECASNRYDSSLGSVTVHSVKYAVKTSNMGTLVYSLSYDDRFDRFSKRDETRESTLGVGHQLQLFKKLYEWHFDLENLIGRGLATQIPSLKEEAKE